MNKPREFWISKGSSGFADVMKSDDDGNDIKMKPDAFYDLVSEYDYIEGGIHVREVMPAGPQDHVHSYDFCICAADEIRENSIKEVAAWIAKSCPYVQNGQMLSEAIESKFLSKESEYGEE